MINQKELNVENEHPEQVSGSKEAEVVETDKDRFRTKFGMTKTPRHPELVSGSFGFTLAEVLITLGIIGVVAAMTLPMLIQNYQKRITSSRLEATYSIVKQAVRMSEAQNGEISEWNFDSLKEDGSTSVKLTQKFVKQYIEPYLKTVHRDELAYSSAPYEYNYYSLNGKLISSSHTHYSLALNNGVYLHFNANYGDNNNNNNIELRIDINGRKRPNTVGIDTFFMHIYPEVKFFREGENRNYLLERCKTPETGGNISYQNACGALIQADGWEIKDDYPWK